MEEDQGVFFIGVSEPEELRKNILGTLRDAVESLERFEKFRDIRKERIDNIERFKKEMKEIYKLMNILNNRLPKAGIKPLADAGQKKEEIKKKQKVQDDSEQKLQKGVFLQKPQSSSSRVLMKEPEKKPKERSELEKLEADLDEIESKLNSLA